MNGAGAGRQGLARRHAASTSAATSPPSTESRATTSPPSTPRPARWSLLQRLAQRHQVRPSRRPTSTVYVGGNFFSAERQSRTPDWLRSSPSNGALSSVGTRRLTTSRSRRWSCRRTGVEARRRRQVHHPQRRAGQRHGRGRRHDRRRACPGPPTPRSPTAAPSAASPASRTDGNQVYGSGFAFGCGNFEGTFAARPDTGAINWANDCHGDTYDTFPVGGCSTRVSHAHNCSTIGGFFQSNPWSINMRHALAFTTNPTGTNTGPTTTAGTTTAFRPPSCCSGTRTLAVGTARARPRRPGRSPATASTSSLGGEFPKVNGVAQQGLVRFAVKNIAPNKRAPVKAPSAPTPSANSFTAGTARVGVAGPRTTWTTPR